MAGIFISYRRDDVPGQVGRLFARLEAHYGADFVFMDVESIAIGQRFEDAIFERIRKSDVILLAMGPSWRLDPPGGAKDYVRLELAEAKKANCQQWALCIDRKDSIEATLLDREFPEALEREICEIRHKTFDADVDHLIAGLEKSAILPPPEFRRQRLARSLSDAGAPYSWLLPLHRSLGLPLTMAAIAAALSVAGWLTYNQGFSAGNAIGHSAARDELTASQALRDDLEQRDSLRISGQVTDGEGPVGEADITLTNTRNSLKASDTTDSFGGYDIDLAKLDIGENDVVRIVVTKDLYRTTTENVKFRDGFRKFRAILRKRGQ